MGEVDRCVCFDVRFERLQAYAAAHDSDLDDLSRRFGCGRGCGLCVPFIRRMLATGRTRFDLDEAADTGDDAQRV